MTRFDTTLGIFALAFEPALFLGAGDDTLRLDAVYNGQSVLAFGGPGFDTVSFGARTTGVTATLAPGFSQIAGESMRPAEFEQMVGGEGNDTLTGVNPRGDGGNDTVIGTDSADNLRGGSGNDVVGGGGGADFLYGDQGDDVLIGGAGTDGFDGGAGFDILSYQDRAAPVTVPFDSSSNDGEPGEAEYAEDDHIEGLRGGSGGDTLIGSVANDNLRGGPAPTRCRVAAAPTCSTARRASTPRPTPNAPRPAPSP